MRTIRTAVVIAVVAVAAAACGGQSSQPGAGAPASTHRPTAQPTTRAATRPPVAKTSGPASSMSASPTTTAALTAAKLPHFSSPQAAMRYLVTAWNDYNMTDLKHVTEPTARLQLIGMYKQAVNLRLDHCELRPGGNGDYMCHFVHDYPATFPVKLRQGRTGTAEFIAAPSASVGWYMFAYEGCG